MAAATQQLSAFELERYARIEANKRKLQELEINDAVNMLQQMRPAKQPRVQKPRAPCPAKDTKEPARRSHRNAGKEKPDYTCQMPLAVFEERQPRARSLKPVSRGSRKLEAKGRYPAWHWGIPEAPDSATEQAQAAAVQRAEELVQEGKRAYVKGMTHSMVGGGGWLQAPQGMHTDYTAGSEVVFTVAEDTHPQTGERFAYTQEKRREGEQRSDAWNVGFLQKRDKDGVPRGGYGFSNNWKGFAVDQFLHPSDFVVFGVTAPNAADMYIFRAWDFATAAQKPQNFDVMRFTPSTAAEGQASAGQDTGAEQGATEDVDASESTGDAQGEYRADQRTKLAKTKMHSKQKGRAKVMSKPSKESTHGAAAAAAVKARKAAVAHVADGVKKWRGSKQQGQLPHAERKAAQAIAAAPGGGSKKRCPAKPKQQQERKQKHKQKQEDEVVEQEEFTVEWILDTKVVPVTNEDGTTAAVRKYKVRWMGYDAGWDSWEPIESFNKPLRQYDWGTLQADGTIKQTLKPQIPKDTQ